ncbi:YALIA101S01e17062g1_1 [Yarrowia lipolytica]|nr:Topoisomerase 1-associated factor 1 [Yarrowia lipolytica]SEI31191.1 YALIA101S01e17062g1_1 [Yarrowia lipolytica]VBB85377.1 Drug resistance protein, putative [Yarrowia lipolytica]
MEEVDRLVTASITSIVSALGGCDLASEDASYVLGEEALACLKDVKQWLRAFDEKLGRSDVAKCIASTTLVVSDIPSILSTWNTQSEAGQASKKMDRVALACLEILVPLLWPIEINDETPDNVVASADLLRQAQIRYKRALLGHPSKSILKAVVRLCIPSVAKSKADRDQRDIGIMKLVVFFIRNMLAIDPMEANGKTDDINRSATLEAFENQGVLDLMLTLGSCTGYDIVGVDLPLLDSLYQMVKGLDVVEIFETSPNEPDNQLKNLLDTERRNKPVGSSRHSRFASTMTVLHNGSKISVTGPTASIEKSLEKFDKSKQPGRRLTKPTTGVWEVPVFVGHSAKRYIRVFSELFNDSAFNPLMQTVRKALEQEDDIGPAFKHYLVVLKWFLGVEMHRKTPDFGLIASVVNQEAFIIIMRSIRQGVQAKNWTMVKTAMDSFKTTLVVVNLMSDEEVASNIKARLFYEEEYLTMLADLTRRWALPLTFLQSAVDMTHTLIKTLESFTKANTTLYVRRRRLRAQKKADDTGNVEDLESLPGEEHESAIESRERKFNFSSFESRYFHEDTFTTYRMVLSSFQQLDNCYLGWCLKFLDRAFNKRKCRVMLFRLDYLQLFRTMVKELNSSNPWRKPFEHFFKKYMRQMIPMMKERPCLMVEVIFAKIPGTLHYLESGEEKPVRELKERTSKFVYEFTEGDDIPEERKVCILVASLLDEEKKQLVEWFIDELDSLLRARTGDTQVLNPPKATDELNVPKSIDEDDKFRLLMELVGFTLSRIPKSSVGCKTLCSLPGEVSRADIERATGWLKQWYSTPVDFEPFNMIKRVRRDDKERRGAGGDKEGSQDAEEDDELPLFLASDSEDDIENINDEMFAPVPKEKQQKTKQKLKRKGTSKSTREREKQRDYTAKTTIDIPMSYKSADFIGASDDDSDDERDRKFFEKENELREELRKAEPTINLEEKVDKAFKRQYAYVSDGEEEPLSETESHKQYREKVDEDRDDLSHMAERENRQYDFGDEGHDSDNLEIIDDDSKSPVAAEGTTSSQPIRKRRIVDDSDDE